MRAAPMPQASYNELIHLGLLVLDELRRAGVDVTVISNNRLVFKGGGKRADYLVRNALRNKYAVIVAIEHEAKGGESA